MKGYNPKDANNAIPAGVYEASIKNVFDEDDKGKQLVTGPNSKTPGCPMERVVFEVYEGERTRLLTVYFVNSPNAIFRYKMLASALGKKADFEAGTFEASAHIGANLRLQLTVKNDAQYGETNEVKDFEPTLIATGSQNPITNPPAARTRPPQAVPAHARQPLEAEDIPF